MDSHKGRNQNDYLPYNNCLKSRQIFRKGERGQALVETLIVITVFVSLALLSHQVSEQAKKELKKSQRVRLK